MKNKTLWIVETAVMIALLVVLQGVTKAAGQFVTGSCVNLILVVSLLVGGIWCGMTVALLSPFFAFMLNIGPALIQIVPFIAVGNILYVILIYFISGKNIFSLSVRAYVGVAAGAVVKFLALWLLIVKLLLPFLGLADKQATVISASFSWPQIVTAAIGGVIGVTVVPVIKKGLKK